MSKIFSMASMGRKPKRSVFDLGHERKFSMNMGDLVPILCEEVIPGDTFKMNTEILMRLAPMVSPVMHRVNVYTHFFFVPSRLIWSEFKGFITGGDTGVSNPVLPYIELNTSQPSLLKPGSLADYLGVATTTASSGFLYRLSALPFRAYQTVYNEFYRDQNLEVPVSFSLGSGSVSGDVNSLMVIRKRAWEKDYFTSALPWTQKGGDVLLPGEIVLDPGSAGTSQIVRDKGTHALTAGGALSADAATSDLSINAAGVVLDPNGTLSQQTTIEELRRASRLQEWLEKNARGGSRYIEQILSHFGVRSSDARLQRPEFLGGGKTPVTISEVLQTSSTDTTTPQANMAGHGVAVGNTHQFKKFFEEHGFVIGIMSVLPKTSYQQGTRKMFKKFDRFDYAWPEFAQLGEQPVLNDELYSTFGSDADAQTFGYQSRYAEYKYIPSSVHGDFKGNLSFWHMGRIFSSAPALNSTFVTSDPTHRVFAVTDPAVTKLYVQIYNDLKAVRPLPYFNVPKL